MRCTLCSQGRRMTKYIIVVGGVISGVGKGVITASLGAIFKQYGHRVCLIKIDPYINVDAGTLRPTEHGEVWVTYDGGEIDQDLGTYERFIDESIPKKNNITTGQIYQAVIERERQGGYLGKTVQFVPHILDEIRNRITDAAAGYDIALIELGGTVGDYENVPFLCAVKSLERLCGRAHVAYVHVTYLPVPSHIGEMKTKPAQQALKLLNESGIFPDLVICRSADEVDAVRRQKIETYAHLPHESVISSPDSSTIYQVPLDLERKGVAQKLMDILGMQPTAVPQWQVWQHALQRITAPSRTITIGIVGKYIESGDYAMTDSYVSISHALLHAGIAHDVRVQITWFNAQEFEMDPAALVRLQACDGILVPGGFGTTGVEGKIATIAYAREQKIPYLGICYGMQLAVVEYARHKAGLHDAATTEVNPSTPHPVVTLLPLQQKLLQGHAYGGTMRLGDYAAHSTPNTHMHRLYSQLHRLQTDGTVIERHRHRYEVNPAYVELLQSHGLCFSGYYEREDGTRLMEFLEIHGHPFFVATQAHPEFTSRLGNPNPLFYGFVQACVSMPTHKYHIQQKTVAVQNNL